MRVIDSRRSGSTRSPANRCEDREFVAAIREKRQPNASLAQVLPCMHVLGRIEEIIDPHREAHA